MNLFTPVAVLTVDNSIVDMETIQALYENVSTTPFLSCPFFCLLSSLQFVKCCLMPYQRAQPDELEQITRHYHTSEEELIKLLDKPEQ